MIMLNDRELLELAAKAAGLTNHVYVDGVSGMCEPKVHGVPHYGYNFASAVNPLDDDGDALRLATKLGMVVDTSAGHETVVTFRVKGKQKCLGDACARRAITMAAAEIGKAHLAAHSTGG